MFKNVLNIASNNLTEIDILIIIVGVISIAFIIFLATIKIFHSGKINKHFLKICLEFSSLYQYGIEACPLLGTLGTVVSLIANSINTSELQNSFLYALTSTLWGLIIALICKALESLFRLNGYFEDKSVENNADEE